MKLLKILRIDKILKRCYNLYENSKRKVGGNINIDKMINMLLLKLSKEYDTFFMERRTYKDNKIYKSFFIKIGDCKEEFRNKRDLLLFLSNF